MKQEGWHMMNTEEIKLRIHEESDLFSPLDPDQRILSDEVISYLSRNYQTMYQKYLTKNGNYVLHIFSDTPVNEAHVKDAIRGHFVHEKDNIQFLSKIESMLLEFWERCFFPQVICCRITRRACL